MNNHRLVIIILLLGMALCACGRGKHYPYEEPVGVVLPARYSKPLAADNLDETIAAHPVLEGHVLDEVLAEWWRLWGNGELDGLVDRALANNHDLRIATWRIAQLEARARQARGAKTPSLALPIEARHEAPRGDAGSVPRGQRPEGEEVYRASLRADWRPDLWGDLRHQQESAELQLWQATFQRDDIQRGVIANLIRSYVEYLTLNDRLRVARNTEKTLNTLLQAVQARLDTGDATIVELEQQRAAVHGVRATIPSLGQQRELIMNQMAALSGDISGDQALSDQGLDALTLPAIMPGLPAALLLRRPDVRAIETRLLAAGADIGAARARILPPLDLTAQVGYASRTLSQMLQPHTLFWSLVANLSISLFDNQQRSSEVVFAEAVHAEMVETYLRVIHDAVREVDDALIRLYNLEWRLGEQQIATEASHRAWQHSLTAYQAGAIDHLTLLDVERTLHKNQDELLVVHQARYQSLVDLFAALGGGVARIGVDPHSWQPLTPEHLDAGTVITTSGFRQAGQPVELRPLTHIDGHPSGVLSLTEARRRLQEAEDAYYLIELAGVYDRNSVAAAGRDLFNRLPQLAPHYVLLPQQEGRIEDASGERASWYRLLLYKFDQLETAEEVCRELLQQQLRCRVLTSDTHSRSYRPRELVSRQTHTAQPRLVILGDVDPPPSVPVVLPPSQTDTIIETDLKDDLPLASEPAPASEAKPPLPDRALTTIDTAPVPVKPPVEYAVQLGAFSERANAERLVEDWVRQGYDVTTYLTRVDSGHIWHVVRMGSFSSMLDAALAAREFNDRENQNAIPVRVLRQS